MAFGDLGGSVTELVITCRTLAAGEVAIAKGDAVKLTGPYTVDNNLLDEDVIFGQALRAADTNDTAIPVMVRGIGRFRYTGADPAVDGESGVVGALSSGAVKAPAAGLGQGRNMKVDAAAGLVHVLL